MSENHAAQGVLRELLARFLLVLLAVFATAGVAQAGVKTINGIAAEVNMPAAQRGVPYSQAIVPTGGGGAPYTFVQTAGVLPAGFSFSNGVLSGTNCAASNGSFTFDVRITSSTGTVAHFTGTNEFSVQMTAGPSDACDLVLGTITGTATVNVTYNSSAAATGGIGPYTYTVINGTLPPGLTLNPATGAVTGTPSAAGTYSFTIQAGDSAGKGGVGNYTVVVAPPTITLAPATVPAGVQGVGYSQLVTASGGVGSYTYAVTAGSLPAGVTLAADGTLAGTPAGSGTFNFTVTATDSNGHTGTRAYSLNVAAAGGISISPASVPAGNQGLAYSTQTLSASGGTGPYSYTVPPGSLPTGMTLDPVTGELSGTPTVSGTFDFTVTATDSTSATGTQTYSLVIVAAPTITLSPASLPDALQNIGYAAQNITASGGTGPHGYAVTSGALPAGLVLDGTTGVLSGTPTASGTFNFTITATDANGYTGSRAYTMDVTAAPSITLSPASLPDALQNIAYAAQSITTSGGTGPYSYIASAGALPPGMSLGPNGTLSGMPTASGTFNFTITATDANGYTGSRAYTMDVTAAPSITLSPASLPDALQNIAYAAQNITASGGIAPYGYAVVSGALPAGLVLDGTTGVLSGMPTASGTFNFTITATDANGYTGARSYALQVSAAPSIAVGPATLPAAVQGTAYSQQVTASGGTAGYTYAVTAGALPPGMTLGSDGSLSGTPTTPGSYAFTITVTDANGYTSSRDYSFTVNEPLAATPGDPVPAIDSSAAITPFQPVAPTGGVGPFSYEISPALPAGLVFDAATGQISGTPTESRPLTTYTVTITDSRSEKAMQDFQMAVLLYTVDLTPATANLGRAGLPVDVQFAGMGGVAPYAILLASGSLPPGLSLASDGHLTGRATQSGTYVVQLRVTDADGITAVRSVTLTVDAPRPDPTQDAGVVALQQGQADSLRRFGLAQTRNTAQRLEALRGCSASRNDLTLGMGEQGTLAASQLDQQARTANCEQTRAAWVGGTVTYTEAGPGGPSDLVTDGVTTGIDVRVAPGLTLGAGLGYSRDANKRLAGGARQSGDGYNVLAYASWEAVPRLFVEGIAGYGEATYEDRRWIELEDVHASATRDASHWFMSLGFAGLVEIGKATVQPYLRADYQAADLDAYREHSPGTLALDYDSASTDTTRYTGGVRANWSWPASFGAIEPMLRLEYRGEDRGGLDQRMRYADGLDGLEYRLHTESATESAGIAGAGIGLRFARGLSAEFEYQTSFASDLPQEQSLGAHVSWSF